MSDTPEKIWAWTYRYEDDRRKDSGEWYLEDAGLDGDETPYIRADLHEALKAENKRLSDTLLSIAAKKHPNEPDNPLKAIARAALKGQGDE